MREPEACAPLRTQKNGALVCARTSYTTCTTTRTSPARLPAVAAKEENGLVPDRMVKHAASADRTVAEVVRRLLEPDHLAAATRLGRGSGPP